MDSQPNSAATLDELIAAVKFAQRHSEQHRNLHGWLVTGHFIFGGLAVAVWVVALICKLAGHQIGDRLTDEYFFSLMTSVMFFAVGTLMIEYMRGDIFAQALGRVLAGCGLFVMSAQGYEFMQESRAVEMEASILAKSRPVGEYQPASYLREVEMNGFRVSWEKEHSDGRGRAMFSVRGQRAGETDCTSASGGRLDSLLGRKPGRAASTDAEHTSTDGRRSL